MKNHINIFTNIYENSLWGNDNNTYYKGSSGGGSEIDNIYDNYIPFIKKFIIDNNIESIIDLGCGNFKNGKYIYDDIKNIKYYGYDAYNDILNYHKKIYNKDKYNFIHLDIFNKKEEIISGDLCIIKDVLQHWSLDEIYIFLDYIIDKYKYIIICNCCNQKKDDTNIYTGDGRPLSGNFYTLKKYNPKILFNFSTKEVSLITKKD